MPYLHAGGTAVGEIVLIAVKARVVGLQIFDAVELKIDFPRVVYRCYQSLDICTCVGVDS